MGRIVHNSPKAIAIILFIVWAVIIIYVIFGIELPHVDRTSIVLITTDLSGNPKYSMQFSFSAEGSISEGNPIKVNGRIFNITNYSQNLDGWWVAFTGSKNIPPVFDANGMPRTGSLPLIKNPNGTYSASGELQWDIGPTLPILINTSTNLSIDNIKNIPTATTIGPSSEIYALRFNLTTERLTWVLMAFSILMIHPILVEIFHNKPK